MTHHNCLGESCFICHDPSRPNSSFTIPVTYSSPLSGVIYDASKPDSALPKHGLCYKCHSTVTSSMIVCWFCDAPINGGLDARQTGGIDPVPVRVTVHKDGRKFSAVRDGKAMTKAELRDLIQDLVQVLSDMPGEATE